MAGEPITSSSAKQSAATTLDDEYRPTTPRQWKWWSIRFWFALYDLMKLVQRPLARRSPDRITRAEMRVVKLAVYFQRRGFGWTD